MGFADDFVYITDIVNFGECSKEKALLRMKEKLERQKDL
jgi:hypothetical protein